MKRYKAVYIGNRPLILSSLLKQQEIEIVHAFFESESLINIEEYAGAKTIISKSNGKQSVLDFLKYGDYDLCISAGCPFILPISSLPSEKIFINTHPSVLPYGKGCHPVNECIISDRALAGVTVHYLTDEVDAGDIIDQVSFDLTDDVDADLLYSFIFDLENEVFKKSIERLINVGFSYCGKPQVGAGSYYSRKDSDLVADVTSIDTVTFLKKVRAFSSISLGVQIRLDGMDITVHRASLINNAFISERFSDAPVGSLLISNEIFLLVRLINGIVRIDKWRVSALPSGVKQVDNSDVIISMVKPLLIFPGGMPRSLEFMEKCLHEKQAVIGASSLAYDVYRERYPEWVHLPFITAPDFNSKLKQVISKYNISGIYSPNPVIWNYLNHVLKDIITGVPLVNSEPVNAELSGYRSAINRARKLLKKPLCLKTDFTAKPSMSEIELAALFRHAEVIPGQCDYDKICALSEIARFSTTGDVVEIGCLWGKSAFVLARLASFYGIGNLLCVDPWSNEHLIQNDPKGLVDNVSNQLDIEEALTVFEINLLPYSHNHVNYLRMPSTEGAEYYRNHRNIITTTFGETAYHGHISVLHVDGNHSYEAAKADISSWSAFVISGGWLVIDDYIWPYGDGPQRAGDEFMAENSDKIAVSFVMGSALFVQLSY